MACARISAPFRNAIKGVASAQTSAPFRNAIKDPVYKKCVHICRFIIPRAVAVPAVSLRARKNELGD